jgi:hypothetical protein
LLEKCDLLLDIGNVVIFRVQIDDLERDDVTCRDMSTPVYSSVRSFTSDL